MNPDVLSRLKEAAGPRGWSEDAAEIAPHLAEWRGRWTGTTPLLLKPAQTSEVARILAVCNDTGTPVVPQGGNTGLVGGQIPTRGEVLLSLSRMNRIRNVNVDDNVIVAEAGVVLAHVQKAAEEVSRLFPLSLAAEGSCTIGGNVSTNAGGVNVLRYGMMRELVLGIEVVLADGRVLDLLRALRKDNTGYDLKQLFIGAEGTLGVVTAAALKLAPRPHSHTTALVGVADPAAAVRLLDRLQDATGNLITAFELIPRIGLELVMKHIPDAADPLPRHNGWLLLIETSNPRAFDPREALQEALLAATGAGIVKDAIIAKNERERAALWRLRDNLSEAQKLEGASLKHDISVPLSRLAEFISATTAEIVAAVPGARPVVFGHIGDGNLHFNVSAPPGNDTAHLAARDRIETLIYEAVHRVAGSISAEHGLGLAKNETIARYKTAEEVAVMRALKQTLDPNNILNPGKVLPP
jgi:FAD/FMN-containing dehydrogenase